MQERKTDISIGLFAYNEENNISRLIGHLEKQNLQKFRINEIMVISASKDNTNRIVKDLTEKNKKIILIEEKKRKGKYAAINIFLKKANSKILVIESADTLPEKNCIEKLCTPLLEKEIGLANARPINYDYGNKNKKKDFWNYAGKIIWDMHHKINLRTNKSGEMIAIKKIIDRIKETSVDEEEVAYEIRNKGYKIAYVPDALVFNKSPEGFIDYVRQRRRIYSGHLFFMSKNKLKIPTANNFFIAKLFLKVRNKDKSLWNLYLIILETLSRTLGYMDFKLKKEPYLWKDSRSAKL